MGRKRGVFTIILSIVLVSLVIVYYYSLNQEHPVIDAQRMSNNYFVEEGYVVSKGFNSLWISDEKISFWKGLMKSLPTDSTQVLKHELIKNDPLFRGIKQGDRVRVKGEAKLESNPPKIHAYSIEILD